LHVEKAAGIAARTLGAKEYPFPIIDTSISEVDGIAVDILQLGRSSVVS
jgi:hypothetical protein